MKCRDDEERHCLTYLRLAGKRLGLLNNSHAVLMKDGITRIVNGLEDEYISHAKPAKKNMVLSV